jgi:hypothetical protein
VICRIAGPLVSFRLNSVMNTWQGVVWKRNRPENLRNLNLSLRNEIFRVQWARMWHVSEQLFVALL